MAASGLGSAPRKLLEEMREVRSLDVVLPTHTGAELRLRTVSRPEPHLAILLDRLDLFLPNRAKKIQNVVATQYCSAHILLVVARILRPVILTQF